MDKVSLVRRNGRLQIAIDGKIYDPLSFKSFRPTERNISDFYKAGVRLFSILSSGMICMLGVEYSLFGESWVGDHEYDFDVIDRQIDLFMENAPDGYFALMLQLDTRPWYLEKHPELAYTFTHLSQTIADETWRNDAADYLQAVLRHVEEKYGDRMYGYFLMCGFTTEWFSQYDKEVRSDSKEAAYRIYCKDDSVSIPPVEWLEIPGDRAFMPPEHMNEVARYRKFNAELIADSLLWFASKAQEVLQHRKLIGAYFGYLFELDNARLFEAGHLAYEKVFTSPDIDMISSPTSYGYRAIDSTSAYMVTYDTLNYHDKLYYLEYDNITHLAPSHIGNIAIPGHNNKLKNQTETLNIMQRDFMMCVSKGSALWWFDMFEGWFYSDEMMDAIRKMIEISANLASYPMTSNAEILVIASGETLYQVNKNAGLNTVFLGRQRDGLARMGAPYDVYSFCDADSIDLSRYKLIMFLDAFSVNENQRSFMKKAASCGRTVLYFYAPDYIDGKTEGMKNITGIDISEMPEAENSVNTEYGTLKYSALPSPRFEVEDSGTEIIGKYTNSGKAAVAMKTFDDHTSVYSAVGALDGGTLNYIARRAGVHTYNNDRLPVYVNETVTGIYAIKGTKLFVPDGVYIDLFTNTRYKSENGVMDIPETQMASRLLVREELLKS